MVDRARVDAQNHWFVYNEPMSVESVTQSVSNLAMMFGEDDDEKPMVRVHVVNEKLLTVYGLGGNILGGCHSSYMCVTIIITIVIKKLCQSLVPILLGIQILFW